MTIKTNYTFRPIPYLRNTNLAYRLPQPVLRADISRLNSRNINYASRLLQPVLQTYENRARVDTQQPLRNPQNSSKSATSHLDIDKYPLGMPYTGTKSQPETVSFFLKQRGKIEFYDEAIINSSGYSPFQCVTAIVRIRKAVRKIWEEIAGARRENSEFGNACKNLIRGCVQLVPVLGNAVLYLFDRLRTHLYFHPQIKAALANHPESSMGVAFDGKIVAEFSASQFLSYLNEGATTPSSSPQEDEKNLALLGYMWLSTLLESPKKTRLQLAEELQSACMKYNPLKPPVNALGSPPSIPLNDVQGQIHYRVQIMNETLNHLKAGFYTSPDGKRHPLDLTRAAQGASLFLSAGNVGQRPGTEATKIVIKNQDCLYAAFELHAEGLNPLVLDMASDGHFGGGYLIGARAQEEEFCRRSGLCFAGDTRHHLQTRNFYPLSSHSPSAGVYIPRVPVFRAGYDKGYQCLNQPFEVACGVFAAFNRPELDYTSGSPRLRPAEAAATREKIRAFLEMAHQKGHQSVVLGALGCGAFRNPPDHIAEITIDVIKKEFAHCFKKVVIAVLDDHNTGHRLNPEGNFKPFAKRALAAGGKAFDANGRELTNI
jgi:uncharacterized protein (TIGR02452 family)